MIDSISFFQSCSNLQIFTQSSLLENLPTQANVKTLFPTLSYAVSAASALMMMIFKPKQPKWHPSSIKMNIQRRSQLQPSIKSTTFHKTMLYCRSTGNRPTTESHSPLPSIHHSHKRELLVLYCDYASTEQPYQENHLQQLSHLKQRYTHKRDIPCPSTDGLQKRQKHQRLPCSHQSSIFRFPWHISL